MKYRFFLPAIAFLVCFAPPATHAAAQERGTPPILSGQRGQPVKPPVKAPVKPPTPLTLRQVIEGLLSLKNSARVEDQISKAGGVEFEATPAVVDILKQFGASPKLISMIPVPPKPPEPPAPVTAGPLTVVCEPKDCAVAVGQKYAGA